MSKGIRVNIKTGECAEYEAEPVVDPGVSAREANELQHMGIINRLKAKGTGPVTRAEFDDLLEYLGLID